MNTSRVRSLAGFFRRLAVVFSLAALPGQAVTVIDQNHDGIGDIYAMKYNAAGLAASGDADGDGKTNGEESAAGTDPWLANSGLVVSAVTIDGTGVHLTWMSVLGKQYWVQSATDLVAGNWQNELPAVAIPGTGDNLSRTYDPAAATGKYYRILVQDMDSDGDGVSDWEEIAVGFDPHNKYSAGLAGQDDLTRITAALSATNVVTILATEPTASEVNLVPGTFTVTRSGNLNPITVNYTVSGGATSGSDYVALSGSVVLGLGVNSATISVTPLADALLESPESVIVTISAAPAYTVGTPSVAAVIINDTVQANGTGLAGQFWDEGSNVVLSQTVLPTFGLAPRVTTAQPVVPAIYAGLTATTAAWAATSSPRPELTGTAFTDGYWSARWSGEVLPEFSQIYTFYLETNFAGRLYVGGQLVVDNWPPKTVTSSSSTAVPTDVTAGSQVSGTIELTAGVRYPVLVEFYQNAGSGRCYLLWASANQAKQYVPATRLFPNTAPQITSATEVTILKGSGQFTYQITASGFPSGATPYSAANLPSGWTVSAAGLISGSPTQAGVWNIPLTASNAYGSGSAILTLTVVDTGALITREVWDGTYNSVAELPLSATPTSTTVTALEGPQTTTEIYGSRLRGYLSAPATGVYQFWLAADDNAELWISNDDEPANLFKRASTSGATSYRAWADASVLPASPTISPLLYLKTGQRYYVEVRHVNSSGAGHVSVGWLKPGQTGNVPSEVVPGYALTPWTAPTGQTAAGTAYLALIAPQVQSNGTLAVTSGSGSSTIRLSADETEANIVINYSNLSSGYFGMHVHDDRIPNPPGGLDNVICDIDQPGDAVKQADGSYRWVLTPRGGFSVAQLVTGLKTGHAYFNVHSTNYPGGELKGFFKLLTGTATFTPPPAPPTFSDDHGDATAAARFLNQATMGASAADVTSVQSLGYEGWINAQFALPTTRHLDYVMSIRNLTDPGSAMYPDAYARYAWWRNSIIAPDQLRQRVAFALNEIQVISQNALTDKSDGCSDYYDAIADRAFGNFRDLLLEVTLHPMMGLYLDMRKNDKPNLASGLHPNENYAREILQLFSIGLNRLHPDGSLMLNSKGLPIETYNQDAIVGFAHVFTGWNYNQANQANGKLPQQWSPSTDYINPMKEVPEHHFTGQKRVLNNVVLPGLTSVAGTALDPYADHTKTPYSRATTIENAAYQSLPSQELTAVHQAIVDHPNCGPFICRQLIQRMVTSTPSPGYIYRVVKAFNGEGDVHGTVTGVRGNMQDVIKAILLDYEARSPVLLNQQGYGKQREPLLRVTALARAFAPTGLIADYSQVDNVITLSATRKPDGTSLPHNLVAGNTTFISFTTGSPRPTDTTYAVVSAPSTTSLTVAAPEVRTATYAQTGTTTVTVTRTAHGLVVGNSVYLSFKTGTVGGLPGNGLYSIATVPTANTFTVEATTAATASGNALVIYHTGGYTQSGTVVTVSTQYNHCLNQNDSVGLTFTANSGVVPVVTAFTVASVINEKQFTVTATNTASGTVNGTVFVGPGAVSLTRTGVTSVGYGTWQIGDTDTDLGQTPLNAPTVFNFFLPDYQFPGLLANNGLITPEFQLTSDINVTRQVNYITSGISNPTGSTYVESSFASGNHSIYLDLTPWMGNRTSGGTGLWVADANVPDLVTTLSSYMMGRPLNTAIRDKIAAYVTGPATGTKNLALSGTPTTQQIRERVRAIVQLISVSPDFTIQK